jgi:hypothetical protein
MMDGDTTADRLWTAEMPWFLESLFLAGGDSGGLSMDGPLVVVDEQEEQLSF